MGGKSALNTSHPLYGNLVFCCGFEDDGSGNVTDLVTGTTGIVNSGSTFGSDPTYGSTLDTAGSGGGVNFGNLQVLDGLSAATVFLWQISTVGNNGANKYPIRKDGGGIDTILMGWASSENWFGGLQTSSSNSYPTLTDGLSTFANQDPTIWHGAGEYYTGTEEVAITGLDYRSAPTAKTGTINVTTHELRIHEAWEGSVAIVALFDKALSIGAGGEWQSLYNDPMSLFAASTPTTPNENHLLGHNF